jgi:hypothetical protein
MMLQFDEPHPRLRERRKSMAHSTLRTTLVHGPLAYAMRRAAAARGRELGTQILTPSQLAAHMAGGFLRPASRVSIEAGIRAALSQQDRLLEIGPISDFPGMTRALRRTLRNIWRSGYDLRAGHGCETKRVRDLAFVEEAIRKNLRPGEELPPDLCRRARASLALAPRTIGSLHIEGMHTIDPIWRPLIEDLGEVVEVIWSASPSADTGWFSGRLELQARSESNCISVSCADPAHEALQPSAEPSGVGAGRGRCWSTAGRVPKTSPFARPRLPVGTMTYWRSRHHPICPSVSCTDVRPLQRAMGNVVQRWPTFCTAALVKPACAALYVSL